MEKTGINFFLADSKTFVLTILVTCMCIHYLIVWIKSNHPNEPNKDEASDPNIHTIRVDTHIQVILQDTNAYKPLSQNLHNKRENSIFGGRKLRIPHRPITGPIASKSETQDSNMIQMTYRHLKRIKSAWSKLDSKLHNLEGKLHDHRKVCVHYRVISARRCSMYAYFLFFEWNIWLGMKKV